jgi:hypothetical protein
MYSGVSICPEFLFFAKGIAKDGFMKATEQAINRLTQAAGQ